MNPANPPGITRAASGPSSLPDLASLPAMDVAGRLARLLDRLDGAGCDALLVSALTNIRYLTGFTGSAAMLLVTPERTVLTTDGRYRTQSARQLEATGVEADIAIGTVAEQQKALAEAASGAARVGLEASSVSWALQRHLDSEVLAGHELVPTSGVVEALRRIKDAGEVGRVEAAARIADAALEDVLDLLAGGGTEADVALALDTAMRRRGATGPAFETIVAAGPNGALPHHRPSARPVGRHELVVIDFGATVDGYRSDMTRTFSAGEPPEVAARMVEVVRRAQAAGVAAVRAGVAASDVDGACRQVIAAEGWADAFVHSTGHGVGIDIHEAPSVAATSADTLDEAAVVTVEPGVYLPEHGGVRIEDTVVVTEEGCRALTAFPKKLLVA